MRRQVSSILCPNDKTDLLFNFSSQTKSENWRTIFFISFSLYMSCASCIIYSFFLIRKYPDLSTIKFCIGLEKQTTINVRFRSTPDDNLTLKFNVLYAQMYPSEWIHLFLSKGPYMRFLWIVSNHLTMQLNESVIDMVFENHNFFKHQID